MSRTPHRAIETTCNGTQPGRTIDFKVTLSPSITVSQVYQMAVFENRFYVITFTHRAALPVGPIVQASLDSLCLKNAKEVSRPVSAR